MVGQVDRDLVRAGALDLVHDLAGSNASDINNEGVAGQVKYIYKQLGKNAKSEIRKRYVDE